MRAKLKAIDKGAIVAQRLKRLPSIVAKLRRFQNMKLSRMQDIGGLRAVLRSLDKVHALEEQYRSSRFFHELVSSDDYIAKPKRSGYRSVHLVYRYRNPRVAAYDGLLIELQFRTQLQHAWATAVETVGTFIKQALKSSEGPEEWLRFFSHTGAAFAHLEGTSPVPGYEHLSKSDVYALVRKTERDLNVRETLTAFSIAGEAIQEGPKSGSYQLLILDMDEKVVRIMTFSKDNLENANEAYSETERQIRDGANKQAVLVSTGSIRALRSAYPSFFLNTRAFIEYLGRINPACL